jgi:hypothetical protein
MLTGENTRTTGVEAVQTETGYEIEEHVFRDLLSPLLSAALWCT